MDEYSKLIKVYNNFKFKGIDQNYNGLLYHYTSPEGLKGIIENKTLFATDLRYMNDSAEYRYVLEMIKNNIDVLCGDDEKIKDGVLFSVDLALFHGLSDPIHRYSISFSMQEDSLTMWNYYTKGDSVKGYAIGFEKWGLLKNLSILIRDDDGKIVERNEKDHLVIFHGKIIYDEKEQIQLLKNIFDEFLKLYDKEVDVDESFIYELTRLMVEKALDYGLFFKKSGFYPEAEYRLIYCTYLSNNFEHSLKGIPRTEKFRLVKGVFVPYQECSFNKDSIKQIRFSPTLRSELSEASLVRFLSANGVQTEEIEESNLTLRY